MAIKYSVEIFTNETWTNTLDQTIRLYVDYEKFFGEWKYRFIAEDDSKNTTEIVTADSQGRTLSLATAYKTWGITKDNSFFYSEPVSEETKEGKFYIIRGTTSKSEENSDYESENKIDLAKFTSFYICPAITVDGVTVGKSVANHDIGQIEAFITAEHLTPQLEFKTESDENFTVFKGSTKESPFLEYTYNPTSIQKLYYRWSYEMTTYTCEWDQYGQLTKIDFANPIKGKGYLSGYLYYPTSGTIFSKNAEEDNSTIPILIETSADENLGFYCWYFGLQTNYEGVAQIGINGYARFFLLDLGPEEMYFDNVYIKVVPGELSSKDFSITNLTDEAVSLICPSNDQEKDENKIYSQSNYNLTTKSEGQLYYSLINETIFDNLHLSSDQTQSDPDVLTNIKNFFEVGYDSAPDFVKCFTNDGWTKKDEVPKVITLSTITDDEIPKYNASKMLSENDTYDDSKKFYLLIYQEADSRYNAAYRIYPAYYTRKSYTIEYLSGKSKNSVWKTDARYYGKQYSIRDVDDTLTNEGYVFTQWSTLSGNGIYQPKGLLSYYGDLILYPQWLKEQYSITYQANGGVTQEEDNVVTIKVVYDSTRNSYSLPDYKVGYSADGTATLAEPTRYGYKLEGWNSLPDSSSEENKFYAIGDTLNKVYDDVTLYADWKSNSNEDDDLYPPIMETYQAPSAYKNNKNNDEQPNIVIKYTMPDYNIGKIDTIKFLHIALVNHSNNTTIWDNNLPMLVVPWNGMRNGVIEHEYDESTSTGIITIDSNYLKDDKYLLDGFQKVQLRFDRTVLDSETNLNYSLEVQNNYLMQAKDNFSEWSKGSLIQFVLPVTINIGTGAIAAIPLKRYVFDFNTENESSDYITNYTVSLLDENNNLLDQKEYIRKDFSDGGIQAIFDLASYNNQTFSLQIEYLTNSGYSDIVQQNIQVADFVKSGDNYVSSPVKITESYVEEEYGYNEIILSENKFINDSQEQKYSYDIFKINKITNQIDFLETKEPAEYIQINEGVNESEHLITFKDYLVESGIPYGYFVQAKIVSTTNKQSGAIKPTNPFQLINDFYDATLFRQNKILKMTYDFQVSQYNKKVGRSMSETIGGQYPKFTKNGKLSYCQLNLSGKISYHDNEDGYFLTLQDIFGEEYTKYILQEQNHDDYTHNTISNNRMWTVEREYRNKVYDWLNDGQPKLLKTGPEGNMIVVLDSVSLTPEQSLGRLIYNFSATAYEIADLTYDNLVSLGIVGE